MAIAKRMTKRGFTLIELMIVVVIIGILAALAIYGVSQYVTNAKTAEARTAVGRMGKDALTAFEGEEMAGAVLGIGSTAAVTRSLCLSATTLVPAGALPAEGTKTQSSPAAWRVDAGTARTGFSCLGFSMDQAILFQYGYGSDAVANTAAAAGENMLAYGQANLGGSIKVISIAGLTQADGTAGALVLTLAPALVESTVATALGAGETTLPAP